MDFFQDEPFTSYMPEALFNIARFLMNEIRELHPKGMSQFAVLYSLAKQARNLGAFKLARQVLEKMQSLRVPPKFQVLQPHWCHDVKIFECKDRRNSQ